MILCLCVSTETAAYPVCHIDPRSIGNRVVINHHCVEADIDLKTQVGIHYGLFLAAATQVDPGTRGIWIGIATGVPAVNSASTGRGCYVNSDSQQRAS